MNWEICVSEHSDSSDDIQRKPAWNPCDLLHMHLCFQCIYLHKCCVLSTDPSDSHFSSWDEGWIGHLVCHLKTFNTITQQRNNKTCYTHVHYYTLLFDAILMWLCQASHLQCFNWNSKDMMCFWIHVWGKVLLSSDLTALNLLKMYLVIL